VQRPSERSQRPQVGRRVVQSSRAEQSKQRLTNRKRTERKRRRQERLQRTVHQRRQASRHEQHRSRNREFSAKRHRHHRKHRPLPVHVYSPPTRHIVITHRPQHNDELFFDQLYQDGTQFGVNGDLSDEETRIHRGIRKGLITSQEAKRLYELLWEAYDLEEECIADGFLTEEEEADLYWAERDLNRAIRWEMRDFERW
jgi:hypothetical protein